MFLCTCLWGIICINKTIQRYIMKVYYLLYDVQRWKFVFLREVLESFIIECLLYITETALPVRKYTQTYKLSKNIKIIINIPKIKRQGVLFENCIIDWPVLEKLLFNIIYMQLSSLLSPKTVPLLSFLSWGRSGFT